MTSVSIANLLLFLLIGALLLPSGFSSIARFQINVLSSVCGAYENFKQTGIFPAPLHDLPQDVLVVQGEQLLERRSCGPGDDSSSCVGSFSLINNEPHESRIVGGQNANQFGPNPEFPWDVKLRMIYDWGSFWIHPIPEDFDRNNITGLKEDFYGSGVLYSRRVILTDPRTCNIGKLFSANGNRFVAWFARGRYVTQRWILEKQYKHHKQTANVYYDEKTFVDAGNPNRICAVSFLEDLPWNRPGERIFAALEVPRQNIDFTGCSGQFAAWGSTDGRYLTDGSVAVKGPSVLQKLKLKVITKKECTDIVKFQGDPLAEEAQGVKSGFLFCANSDDPLHKRWCYGDWGAPLVCTRTEHGLQKTYMAGIKSQWYLYKHGNTKFECESGSQSQFQTTIFVTYKSIQWLIEKKGIGYQTPADLYPHKRVL